MNPAFNGQRSHANIPGTLPQASMNAAPLALTVL
jgi:hypothetical protein